MRILALDYGSKRVGVAISDELKLIAQPLEFIPAKPFGKLLERLESLLDEHEVELIIVGLPRSLDGTEGPAAVKVREFVEALQSVVSVPIRTWDERLTSAQATRSLLEGGVRRQGRK